jgi:hypothetical protein
MLTNVDKTVADTKKGFSFNYRNPFCFLVGRAGIEPAANGLKVLIKINDIKRLQAITLTRH